MGYLANQAILDCVAQLERANIPIKEATAGLRSKAPALSTGMGLMALFHELNEHPEPALLREWLLDLHMLLRLRAWPDEGLRILLDAVEVARQSTPWGTLLEAEQLYQKALSFELERARTELRDLKDPRKHVATPADRERVSTRIEHIEHEIRRGRLAQSSDVLNGRYELEEPIGRGGFSIVWLGFDRNSDEHVAIKILRGELRNDENARQRFFAGAARMQRECRTNAGVVRVLDPRCQDGPYHYFVMEYVTGGTLDQLVTKNPIGVRAEAENILLATCDVVSKLHAHDCLHLDIKPSNILIDDQRRPKLTDFEHVHHIRDIAATHQGRPHLSPHYSAPELSANGTARQESDVFSLARVALFIQLGHSLDQSIEATDFLDEPQFSVALVEVLRKATHRDPDLRYIDTNALRTALAEAFSDPGDFDRWMKNVAVPNTIHRQGTDAKRAIYELLRTLGDTAQLRRLLGHLGYEPMMVGDGGSLVEVADDIAEFICRQRGPLHFWSRLEQRRVRIIEHITKPNPATPTSKLHALVVAEIPVELLRFLALMSLSTAGSAELLQSSNTHYLEVVTHTLMLLAREESLDRFAAFLVLMRPSLGGRLKNEQGLTLSNQDIVHPLWSVWRSIPEVNPGFHLRDRMPRFAHGFLSPLWSESRIRLEGAIHIYRHRMVEEPSVSIVLPEKADEALALLLTLMFDDYELRDLAAYFGSSIMGELRGHQVPMRMLATSFVAVLVRMGPLTTFFSLLLRRRPHWEDELLMIAELYGLTQGSCLNAELPLPAVGWLLGEILLSAILHPSFRLEQIGVPAKVIAGLMVAPRVRAQQAAIWLFRCGLVDHALIAKLRDLAPHLDREISEFSARLESWEDLGPFAAY